MTDIGRPIALPDCKGWLLERTIGEGPERDAVGPYPLFACQDWSKLATDLAALDPVLVSVGLVTDPFAEVDKDLLRQSFPDSVLPFKEHFVVDLARVSSQTIHPHHRRNARQAYKHLTIERCADPLASLDDWERLYQVLRDRHAIQGMAAFSRNAFARQLAMPEMVAYRALDDGKTVGMVLWLVGDDAAYYHLAAYDAVGYDRKASFGLFDAAIQDLAGQVRWLGLGAGAGLEADGTDGLTRFKAGWATDRRQVYFCGRIGQPETYRRLAQRNPQDAPYFPAYRSR